MPRNAGLSQAEAKKKVLDGIASGLSVAAATKAVGRSPKTHENWRNQDKDYAAAVDEARDRLKRAKEQGKDVDLYNLTFAEWRKRFLHRDSYPHMDDMIAALEGTLEKPYHDAIDWDQRNPNRVIVNIPPFHAKSQLITADYVLYKLCMNPNFRVLIISSKAEFSKKFIHQIRQRMTSTLFTELQAAYAPEGGWKPQRGEGAFSNNQLYIAGRDMDEKDPNVEAVGIGGSIYGSRADLAILDDVVVGTNANEYEKQIYWLESELENRLFNGKIIIVGTRLASIDMYSELRNGDRYMSGETPWSYLRMPMVLEEREDPKDWVTLWPRSYQPMDANDPGEQDADGMYPAHDWERAYRTKQSKPPKVWSLVYQQMDVPDDATFHPTCVRGSVQGQRKPGPLIAGALGHPKHGSEGMYVIGSIDPAGTGEAFLLVYAIERTTGKRYVLNCWKADHTLPDWYRQQIEIITEQYGVQEWVIESQAYSSWIIHDPGIVNYCRNRGIKLTGHYTGKNKIDPDFGVASMSPLFGTMRRNQEGGKTMHCGDNIIYLPDPGKSPGVKALVDQLMTWVPGKTGGKLRQDGPMALWFAETRARTILTGGEKPPQHHVHNKYLSSRSYARRAVLPTGY